jgi:hypothetical protein
MSTASRSASAVPPVFIMTTVTPCSAAASVRPRRATANTGFSMPSWMTPIVPERPVFIPRAKPFGR